MAETRLVVRGKREAELPSCSTKFEIGLAVVELEQRLIAPFALRLLHRGRSSGRAAAMMHSKDGNLDFNSDQENYHLTTNPTIL
jgi:hypothetical protein